MARYKCYLMDALDRIRHVESIEAGDDDAARERGAVLLRQHPALASVQISDGERRVGA
ncbi:MAG: hypothetical protein HY060_26020 [Proteobacteria bacterium]|nr:hypothetical protein [Pseudomonadota bacterium]